MSAKPTAPIAPAAPCERVNILLDIDETLVYYISGKVRAHSWDKLTPAEQAKYNFSTRSPTDGVLILRPHVREFLAYLFRYFSVSLWTLSEREYAEDIAGVLLKLFKKRTPNQRFAHIFSADDDEERKSARSLHGNNKDLNWLWYKYAKDFPCFAECNTILIDDLPANALNNSNRHNTVKIAPFALFGEVKARTDPYEDVSEDDVLPQLIAILKKVRAAQNDCYNDDEARWYWAFRESNVKRIGLDAYYLPQEWKGEKFRSMTVNRTKSASVKSSAASAASAESAKSSSPKPATKKTGGAGSKSSPSSKSPSSPTQKAQRDLNKELAKLPSDVLRIVNDAHLANMKLDSELSALKNPLHHPNREQIKSMVHANKETVRDGWSPPFKFNGKQYITLTSYTRNAGGMLNFYMYEIVPNLEGKPNPVIGKAFIRNTLRVEYESNDTAAEQYFVAALAIRMRYLNLDTPEILDSGTYQMSLAKGQAVRLAKPFRQRVAELFHSEENLKILQDMYMEKHREKESAKRALDVAKVATKNVRTSPPKPTLAEMVSRARAKKSSPRA